ncbi:MAG: hypothetical protein AAGM67_04390 [Bacteroidota bacterium]
MKKKALFLFTCLLLIVSICFTGCPDSPDDEKITEPAPQEQVKEEKAPAEKMEEKAPAEKMEEKTSMEVTPLEVILPSEKVMDAGVSE